MRRLTAWMARSTNGETFRVGEHALYLAMSLACLAALLGGLGWLFTAPLALLRLGYALAGLVVLCMCLFIVSEGVAMWRLRRTPQRRAR